MSENYKIQINSKNENHPHVFERVASGLYLVLPSTTA